MSLFQGNAVANPSGASIINGQAVFDSSGNVMNITNSPNAIINWQDFNISQNEITRFIQQNGQSAVLNRVIGGNPSEILGQLISNGQVFLINPNGIIFGADAMIDTQGLIASTLNLSDEDFLSGNYHFVAGSKAGDILNQGIIRAGTDGNVILIAPEIENSGIISTEGGQITLAAGHELTITNLDSPEIQFQIQAPENRVLNIGKILTEGGAINVFAGSIHHSGELNADSVEIDKQGNIRLVALQDVKLDAGSLVSANNVSGKAGSITLQAATIEQSGKLEAVSETATGGNITLHADRSILQNGDASLDVSGSTGGVIYQTAGEQITASANFDATGTAQQGGKIDISAPEMQLSAASLNADGANEGGQIRVGGEYQGGKHLETDELPNAQTLHVDENTTIDANATLLGDAGTVILWSDVKSVLFPEINAVATTGYQGGFIEISSKDQLVWHGVANAGVGGRILFDPKNIIVNSTGTDYPDLLFSDDTGSTSTISPANIKTSLDFGSDVILQANNDLTVNSAITAMAYTAGTIGDLSLSAGRSININADIFTDDGDFTALANASSSAGVIDGKRETGAATFAMADGVTIDAGKGTIDIKIDDAAGLTNTTNGDMNIEKLIAENIKLRLHGATDGGMIQATSEDSLIQADNVLIHHDDAPNGSIGTATQSLNINTDNLDAFIHEETSGGIFIKAGQDTTLGGTNLSAAGHDEHGVQTMSGGKIYLDASGHTLTMMATAASSDGDVTLLADEIQVDVSLINSGSGTMSLIADDVFINEDAIFDGLLNISNRLTVQSGTMLTLMDNATANTATLNAGSTLAGSGVLTLNNLSIPGAVSISNNLNLNGTGILKNSGSINGTGSLNIASSGLFSLQNDNAINIDVNNSGTLQKTAGTGTSTLSGAVSNTGLFDIDSGTLEVSADSWTNSGIIDTGTDTLFALTAADSTFTNAGILQGSGTIKAANVINEGIISPGASPGALTILGNLILTPASVIFMELAGTFPGELHDQINVTGFAALDGILLVEHINGYFPEIGDSFSLITCGLGCFNNFTNSVLPDAGYTYSINGDHVGLQFSSSSDPSSSFFLDSGVLALIDDIDAGTILFLDEDDEFEDELEKYWQEEQEDQEDQEGKSTINQCNASYGAAGSI